MTSCNWIFALGLALASVAHADPYYRLEAAVTLTGATPDWDYVTLDAARGYLFIGRRAAGVTVFDVVAQKSVRDLDRSADANAVVLLPNLDRGFSTNGDGTSTVFELSTLRTLDRVKIGDDADSAFYEPVTGQLAFTMGDSSRMVFVDARTAKVVGAVAIDSHKLDATVADGTGILFTALRDRNAVARIDAVHHTLLGLWKTAPCEEPTGIAYDERGRRLFVGCRGKSPMVAVIDAESGAVLTTLEIGRGNDGVVFDAATRRIYTSNGVDANLVIYEQLDPDRYRLVEATTTRPYARTMALDPRTKKVYLVTAEGTVDPGRKINRAVAPFYPNRYFTDTFTVLTYAPR